MTPFFFGVTPDDLPPGDMTPFAGEQFSVPLSSKGYRCSLCGLLWLNGKRARVSTRGGWFAHEECVASVPEVRA